MNNRLTPILLQKQREVAALRKRIAQDPQHVIAQALHADIKCRQPSFKQALQRDELAVIAEIKRRSPSKGMLAPILNPTHLAQRYLEGGANTLSILTDQQYFGGHLDDLTQVANAISMNPVPILRKDFTIDTIQIAEAVVAGASAVLCIIAAVGYQAKQLIEFAHSLQLAVLVEIHDREELKIALDCGAEIIGINNRNLQTFEVNTNHALEIAQDIPSHIIKVAESGITHPSLAISYYQAGFNAVLIGEALVKSGHPEQFIRACKNESLRN